jgi:hypothetical protein
MTSGIRSALLTFLSNSPHCKNNRTATQPLTVKSTDRELALGLQARPIVLRGAQLLLLLLLLL